MSAWIPLLVRSEDYAELAAIVAEREEKRDDETLPTVSMDEGAGADRAFMTSTTDETDYSAALAAYPSWSVDELTRLASGAALTAQRWTKALDVVAASDSQVWFTTSEIAERAGMTINEWRDAPRKLPQHLKANYPNAPRAENGRLAWPLLAWSLTSAELSWAMTPETKVAWRKIRGI